MHFTAGIITEEICAAGESEPELIRLSRLRTDDYPPMSITVRTRVRDRLPPQDQCEYNPVPPILMRR